MGNLQPQSSGRTRGDAGWLGPGTKLGISATSSGDYFPGDIHECGHRASTRPLHLYRTGHVSPHSDRFAHYLKARRAQLSPEDVGFPRDSGRRVSGLKREEVAELAGISLEYYVRLEQGQDYQVSEPVLAGLTRALMLDADAATYLYRLALPEPPTFQSNTTEVSVLVRHLAETWSDVPVSIGDRNLDTLFVNDLSRAIFPAMKVGGNSALAIFSVPAEVRGLATWQNLARSCVAALRFNGDPTDPRLQAIVGELSVRDPQFREMWADHEAKPLTSGPIEVFIADVGLVEFEWQVLNVPGGLFMAVWIPAPGSLAAEAIARMRERRSSNVPLAEAQAS